MLYFWYDKKRCKSRDKYNWGEFMLMIEKLVEILKLDLIVGEEGLLKLIKNVDILRLGLEMVGYFLYYVLDRI